MEKDVGVLRDRRPPAEFYERMRLQLGEEYESFVQGFSRLPWQGVRANLLKISPEALRSLLPFTLAPVRWCGEGFTFPPGERPAKLTEYSAGLFYIQEPSAMLPAVLLDARPGERVLDVCAAPGGKSVQLAGGLNGGGMLVSNDVSASRSRALVKNLELAGVTNAAVFNEQPSRLAERFSGFFDKILVDAPCSGEGMFRRDADASKKWAENKPQACAAMQTEILRYASVMLAPGGSLVYSTCTFSEIENEDMIAEFLREHSDFKLLPVDSKAFGAESGKLPGTVRVWPHKADGEGHFAAVLQKTLSLPGGPDGNAKGNNKKGGFLKNPPPEAFKQFCVRHLSLLAGSALLSGSFTVNGVSLYRVPEGLPDTRGLRLARSGWYMGDVSNGRFAPSQALAMGVKMSDAAAAAELKKDEAERYLKGETITPEASSVSNVTAAGNKPWVLVGCGGFPLGWARLVNGRLKNHLPPGWVKN